MKTKLQLAQAILIALSSAVHSVHAQKSTLTGYIEGIGDQPIIFWYDVDVKNNKTLFTPLMTALPIIRNLATMVTDFALHSIAIIY